MIIAFISLKGGVGKSTLAVHAYGYAQREGFNVWLVDMDVQASSSQWLDGIDPASNCYHLPKAEEATKAIKARGADSDLVIVDGGGGLLEPTRVGLMVADLVVIPTRASRLDYTATLEVLRLANRVRVERGKGAAKLLVVPSMIQAGQLVTNQLIDELDELDVPIGQPIHQRSAFTKAAGDLNYVWNQKDNNATAEVEMLMQSVLER